MGFPEYTGELTETKPIDTPNPATVKWLRLILTIAKGNHIIWGRMLQGQAAIDNMPGEDYKPLIEALRIRRPDLLEE